MNINQLKEVIDKYSKLLRGTGIRPRRYPDDALATDFKLELEHCVWMLEEMNQMIGKLLQANRDSLSYEARDNIWDKLNQWLGFLSGVLWVQSAFTFKQLSNLEHDNYERVS